MLNIPSSVKALFQADGVHKNFRVHFPNGEMADITNDNVVQESVKFTESLCSQSTFKFGLAEASVLEFETVGIGNMYGMTIQASCEIDCSSLSAADKATIAAGTWDGTWDAVNEVFAVPYGTFRVDSCPRDHQSMAHRQVTAYGRLNAYNPYESAKLNIFVPEKTYSPNAYYSTLALLGYNNKDGILSLGFTEAATTAWRPKSGDSALNLTKTVTLKDSHGNSVDYSSSVGFYQAVYPTTGTPSVSTYSETDRLYAVDLHGENYNTTLQGVASALSHEDIDLAASGYESWDDLARDIFHQDLAGVPLVYAGFVYEINNGPDPFYNQVGTICRIMTSNDAVYPYMGYTEYSFGRPMTVGRFYLPYQFNIYDNNSSSVYARTITRATVTAYVPNSAVPSLPLAIAETATKNFTRNATTYAAYQHGGSVDAAKLAQGFLEINARFALLSRTGVLDFFRLDNSSPLAIVPDDYSECWWDEFDVDAIGTVSITYKTKDENDNESETGADITIGLGSSVYDMTGNDVLKNIESVTLQNVSDMVNTYFAPYASTVSFTPIELDMQGWPWLEAGDALEIEAEDGTTVETYALRVEMSGIQNLQAVITAEGGEIIEEVQ